YANEENNVIYSHKLAENVFRKLDSDTKRLNRLFRSYFKTIKGPAISYKKGEGFKVQFGKLYLKDTDYDKAREVTTNALQDIPDSNIKDYENLD
ncbi:MAG: hypothetical protein H8D23_40945, partial [Candidatus Brocadiales bacterium]|nr:hypothetical protein [Candidatus Brocadiales bacterium]